MKTTINGQEFEFHPRHDETVIDVLRNRAGLSGTKMSCGGGICGACTVRVNDVPMCSCLMPATQMEDADIRTIEDHDLDNLHPVQRAFMANEGLQCGFCTPGFINEGIAFYDRWRAQHGKSEPSKHEVALAMGGHLCRCAAYVGIYAAIQKACTGEYDDLKDSVIHRVDAPLKVTGAAKYTVDIEFDGQLEGKILRSEYAHANIKSIDWSEAEQIEGVGGVIDLLGNEKKVRWFGQPIAAIAAVNEHTALLALKLIRVEYEVLPAVIGPDAASHADASTVWEKDARKGIPSAAEGIDLPYRWKNNVGHVPSDIAISPFRGRAKRALARVRSDQPSKLVERTYRNPQQAHTALEPRAAIARWDGRDKLHVEASTQSVFLLHLELAEHFGIDADNVTVNGKFIGGAFGAKGGLYQEILIAAELARAADAPVRIANSRLEELSYAGARTGSEAEIALSVKNDGSPDAMKFHTYGDAGIAAGAAPAAFYWMMSPSGLKRDFSDNIIVNNTPPTMPMRAPDAPQKRWSVEQAIDEAAILNEVDQVALRRKWAGKNKIQHRLLDWVEAIPQWRDRSKAAAADSGRYKRGIGLAQAKWLFLYHPHTELRVSSSPNGFVAFNATQDVGNGIRTSIAKAMEDTLGVSRHNFTIEIGDSELPVGCMSTGSQGTVSVYPTAVKACEKVIEHLVQQASKRGLSDVRADIGGVKHSEGFMPWDEIQKDAEPFEYTDKRGAEPMYKGIRMPMAMMGQTMPAMGQNMSQSAIVTEVEVDTKLGKIKPTNVWSGMACGKIQLPELANSQMYGGIIQGLGFALYEEKVIDPQTGATLSANMNDYRIPGIGDTPDIHLHYDQEGFEFVRGGGIGLAEHATIAIAASVGNAVYHATGWRPTQTPITPQDLLTGLKELA